MAHTPSSAHIFHQGAPYLHPFARLCKVSPKGRKGAMRVSQSQRPFSFCNAVQPGSLFWPGIRPEGVGVPWNMMRCGGRLGPMISTRDKNIPSVLIPEKIPGKCGGMRWSLWLLRLKRSVLPAIIERAKKYWRISNILTSTQHLMPNGESFFVNFPFKPD